jgi:hypothetical protein
MKRKGGIPSRRSKLFRRTIICGALLFSLSQCWLSNAAPWPDEVPNFAMLDVHGRYHEFHRTDARALVLFFTGNECPVARQCIPKLGHLRKQFADADVAIWAVDSNAGDDRQSILKEVNKLKAHRGIPFLRDDTQGVAQLLGVNRTGTAVVLSCKDGRVIYHGAIDDQLSEGASKPEAQNHYLETALNEFLAGKTITETNTSPRGCLITFERKFKETEVSYAKDVAPILEKHCASCHSAGNIGPFAMSEYRKVKSKSEMIQEVLLSRRMPPWSADEEFGHYTDERTMTLDEKRILLAWITQGAQRGEDEDPLPKLAIPPAEYWPLGKPDYIAKLPMPEEVPPTGVLEYRHITVDSPVDEDTWLSAVTIHPGNLKVVHHCIVRVRYPKGPDDGSGRGSWLQGWAPGASVVRFPEGTGRLLPKGSTLDIEMHYTTMGVAQTDQTEIGFYKLPAKPNMVLHNVGVYNLDFSISPNENDSETFATYSVSKDALLYAMSPHMHLRGAWMRYEALYPTGKREVLLSVPHYDFNWQTSYRLPQPKLLPAGTWILCSGGFDNSSLNPNNPGPSKRISWGDQSFEEMFIGFMEAAEVPRPSHTASASTKTGSDAAESNH